MCCTCSTEEASRKSIMGDSLSVWTSKEKAKWRPVSILSNSALH